MSFPTVMGKPQTEILLDHFKLRESISALEARALYRIDSLSRRINDLEEQGHKFRREKKKDETRKRYVRYHYEGKRNA